MTLIRYEQVFWSSGRLRRTDALVRCDFCGKESIKNTVALKYELHFCNKKCQLQSLSDSDSLIHGKIKQAQVDKFGCYFVDTQKFKDDQQQFCLETYGVKSRLECPEILSKIKETCLEKYGRETFAGSEAYESKIDRRDIADKAWQTKIKNGTCSKSGPEEKLNALLIEEFGESNVQRQVKMIGQWIDFYIASTNTYVQVDGIYWHGLNRPLKEIKKQKTTQDKKIYKQVLRDRKLNKYARKNNLKLVRITDEEIKQLSDAELLNKITGE